MAKILGVWLMIVSTGVLAGTQLRVATFNVSMDGSNYVARGDRPTGQELPLRLAAGDAPQIKNVAEIIQRVRPDIILLNEFDYMADTATGVQAFIKRYLNTAQEGQQAIDYPYFFVAPVNTGVDSGLDLDRDGEASGVAGDAFGFGYYPGQYGMVILSRYPIVTQKSRTFQHFLWRDMPNGLLSSIRDVRGAAWYSEAAQTVLRLSSKSHWDVPIRIGEQTLHVLASHPTPPVFDGDENRNGKRNHDEIRFWSDYLTGAQLPQAAAYIYDDKGHQGGFQGERFVVMGDLNANPDEGEAHGSAITKLLNHPLVNTQVIPKSVGGEQARPGNKFAGSHTAAWGMRADYVIPSKNGLAVVASGVFWPTQDEPQARLIANRRASSDHRLVWLDVQLTE